MRYHVMRKNEIAPNIWGKPVSTGWTVDRAVAEHNADNRNAAEKHQRRRRRVNYFVANIAT